MFSVIESERSTVSFFLGVSSLSLKTIGSRFARYDFCVGRQVWGEDFTVEPPDSKEDFSAETLTLGDDFPIKRQILGVGIFPQFSG